LVYEVKKAVIESCSKDSDDNMSKEKVKPPQKKRANQKRKCTAVADGK